MKKTVFTIIGVILGIFASSALASDVSDPGFTYNNGVFTVTENNAELILNKVNLPIEESERHIDEVGYYFTNNPDDKIVMKEDLRLWHGDLVIKDLKAGDQISLYVASKAVVGEHTGKIYYPAIQYTSEQLEHFFSYESQLQNVFYFADIDDEDIYNLYSFTLSAPKKTPSGSPLPGVLTSLLIGGGLAGGIKKLRKKNKK